MANNEYRDAFIRHLDEKEYKYQVVDEWTVRIGFSAKNLNSIDLFLFFDQKGEKYVFIRSSSIGPFPEEKRAAAMAVCNEMNAAYQWVRFFLRQGEVMAAIDVMADVNSAGENLMELCILMVNIIDEAYPAFMKERWG